MIILQILLLLVPAMISVLLFEKFRGYEMSTQKRVIFLLIFAFLINMLCLGVFWMRGWEHLNWTLGEESSMAHTWFTVQYMVISLVTAVVLAFILSLVRVGRRK